MAMESLDADCVECLDCAVSVEIAPDALPLHVGRVVGTVLLVLFFGLLIGLPLLTSAMPSHGPSGTV